MINARIKELRKEMNLSQAQLGKEINLSPRTISDYESGRIEPNIATIKKLCDFFDVKAGYLLGFED